MVYYTKKVDSVEGNCSDWLLKLRISFAFHLRATCVGFGPKNIVIVPGINELKPSFGAI